MRSILCILILLLLLLQPLGAFAKENAMALYVSPQGDDNADGSLNAPLQTLGEAIARLRSEAYDAATIWMRGGTHRFSETLRLGRGDPGNLSIQAYPGETPVLTGDMPVTGWEKVMHNGQPLWAAHVETEAIRTLYGGHGILPNTRWPRKGTLSAAGPIHQNDSQFAQRPAFYADPKKLPESLDGAYVRLLHWWKDELSGVKAYDTATGRITLKRSMSMGVREGDPFWLENVMDKLFEPGEWAFDAKTKTLYYAPMPGEEMESTVLYRGALEMLLLFNGVSNITFEGLTFSRTAFAIPHQDSSPDFAQAAFDAAATVYVENGKNIIFSNCAFRNIGAGCIRMGANIKDSAIRNCTFESIGAQAIYIMGRNTKDDAYTTRRITIENNLIEGYGRNFLNAPGILIIHAGDMDIRHNEIHDGAYTGISAGWVWGRDFNATDSLRIESNLIYDIGQGMLSDMGGIYTLGVQKNTIISGNVIYNVRAREYGGWGIYLDEGASGIRVENNLVYDCSSQGFHQHDGVTNTVQNNVFAFSEEGQIGASDKRGSGTFVVDGNLLIGKEPFIWRKYGVEKIDMGDNLYYADASPFADLNGGSFTLVDDPAFESVGFIPWESQAGRK